jgi:hypothetical protein
MKILIFVFILTAPIILENTTYGLTNDIICNENGCKCRVGGNC